MLTYEALLEQAGARQMPVSKMRGILREYLQTLILKALYRIEAGRKLYFTGGTYLRLVHGTKRFSEDLDFNTGSLKKSAFEAVVQASAVELKRVNLSCIVGFKHFDNIFAADMIFPDIEKLYGVVSPHTKKAGLSIKVETNTPGWKIISETRVISGFGELYPCFCTQRGALFADKIDALVKKTRGRHLYDIIFMLSQGYPIDYDVLRVLRIKEPPLEVIRKRVEGFSSSELTKQAESLRPFLFEESDADIIINAHAVIPALIEEYKRKAVK
jgi:hypothetical protein